MLYSSLFKKINFILVLLLLLVSIGAVSAADDLNDTIASDDGAILENIVYLELIRRGYSVKISKINKKEIDLYVNVIIKKYTFEFVRCNI